ncbi:MAG: electron transfer flavoprotein subunit alpha/FixB family protein [Solirubrobacterales bacterium]
MSAGVLVVAEARDGELRDVSLELAGSALALSAEGAGPVRILLVDPDPDRLAGALAVDGVEEVLTVASGTESFEPHVWRAAVAAVIDSVDPALVLLGHTVDGFGYGPALAAAGGFGFASDVTAVSWDGSPRARRGAYGDKLEAELEFPDKQRTVLMLRAGAAEPAPATGTAVPARAIEVTLEGVARTERLGLRVAEGDGEVDIAEAEILLSIGRGVDDGGEVERFEELAARLGAQLSVSRPIVDAGWASNARQVGQSGKTVKPRLYLALGISGAVQHLAGIRGAETVVAVNTDPEAPIFAVAHYGAVADLFEVAKELERALA